MLRDLRVPGPELKCHEPSTLITPSGLTCELPSGLLVVNQAVWRPGPPVPGAWVSSPSITARTRAQSIVGAPYPSRLRPEVGSLPGITALPSAGSPASEV